MSDLFGWRIALLAPALFGAVTLALIALRFGETLVRPNPDALRLGTLVSTWAMVLRNPTFLAFSALTTAAYGLLFTFLAASSFVFIQVLGLTKTQYGLVMLWNSLAYIAGTFVCRRWLPRYGVRGSVARASLLTLAGGSAMGLLALAGVHSVAAIVAPLTLTMLAHGVHQPCGQTGAVGPFPQAAGAASALNGFIMMLAAFGIGGWLGARMDGTVLPLALGMWFWSVCIALVAWTLVRRYGEAHARVEAGYVALAGPTAPARPRAALAIARRGRSRSSASTRRWSTAAWTSAPPSPRAAERAAAPHHLIDIRDPREPY